MFDIAPAWMGLTDESRRTLRFFWDDTRASSDFRTDASWVLDAADALCTRAQMVLCVGLYEWVRWRFDGLHADPVPAQIAEAAWCATVDPRYMTWFELDRAAWSGPVGGPLWCAATWLHPALTQGDERPQEIADGLDYLTRLAQHVVPQPERLDAWLKAVLPRLAALFPATAPELFEDLFERRTGERRGPLIGPQALDPTTPYDAGAGRASVATLLARAHPGDNPFLASPGEMLEAGFDGTPYTIGTQL
jgi:hypothetical protein